MNLSVRLASTEEDFEGARKLFRDYGAHLAESPSGAVGICIEGFEQEIAALPGKYAAPSGTLLLAQVDGENVGCVALHAINPKSHANLAERSCEMKRLWIGKSFRGLKLGRTLVEAAVGWAREARYDAMYLDTAPDAMPAAEALYRSLGFLQIERYNSNPVPGIVFFRLSLK